MSNGSENDPLLKTPVTPAAKEPEPAHGAGGGWVVVHSGGEGSRPHVESLARELRDAGIESRIEHDDEHRLVLEVHEHNEHAAKHVLRSSNTHGADEIAHQSHEQRIETQERGALSGLFKASRWAWLLIIVAVATLALLAFYFLR